VDAKHFKPGMMLAVVSRRIDTIFSSVSHFRCVDLFSFINEKASSQMKVVLNKFSQTAAFWRTFGYLSSGRHKS
jgi:hypothetical protein